MLTVEADVTARELEAAANFLNEHFRGWSIERVRGRLGGWWSGEQSEVQRLLSSVEQLWAARCRRRGGRADGGCGGGGEPAGARGVGSAEEVARLREVLSALEAKQRLVELLDAYIDAKQESVRVIFDLEEHAPEMAGLVLDCGPARMAGDGHGTVGVIGRNASTTRNDERGELYRAGVRADAASTGVREVTGCWLRCGAAARARANTEILAAPDDDVKHATTKAKCGDSSCPSQQAGRGSRSLRSE